MFSKSVLALAAIALCGVLLGPRPASSQASAENGEAAKQRKSTKNEVTLQHARERVDSILREENGCSAWFRETDPHAASVFESLHIEIAQKSREYVQHMVDAKGANTYKHPWGARSNQLAGPGSFVEVNPQGPFFVSSLPVVESSFGGPSLISYSRYRNLTVGGFHGDSLEAQMTILLHELAHVIGRIPVDDDSWDGRSTRNTEEVLRNCRSEIVDSTQKSLHAAN